MFQHQQQWGLETSFRILLYVGSGNTMAVTVPGVRFCVCRKRVPLYEADLNALWVLQSQTDLSAFGADWHLLTCHRVLCTSGG